jgi:hypothetical protein
MCILSFNFIGGVLKKRSEELKLGCEILWQGYILSTAGDSYLIPLTRHVLGRGY